MMRKFSVQDPLPWIAIALYAITRAPLLGRELTFEEPLWIRGALELLRAGDFHFYYGEFDPNFSGFHKPPLISILLAASSALLGSETSAAFRAMPYILNAISLALLLQCARRAGSSLPRVAMLFIFFPYLLVSNAYIQTDPTVGIFGYLLALWAVLAWLDGEKLAPYAAITFASAWLAAGKTEILIMSTAAAIAVVALASLRAGFCSWRRSLAFLGSLGVGAAVGLLAVYGFSQAVTGSDSGFREIYATIRGALHGIPAAAPERSIADKLFAAWSQIQGPVFKWNLHLLLLLAVVMFLLRFPFKTQRGESSQLAIYAVWIFVAVPLLIYTIGGYVGGAFPRTMVIAVPGLILLAGLQSSAGRYFNGLGWLLVCLFVAVNVPRFRDVEENPQSWTEFMGMRGFQSAGELLKGYLPPGTPIMASDPVGFYYGGPYYDFALIEAYPDRMKTLLEGPVAERIRAWAYFSDLMEYSPQGRMRKFWDKLAAACQIERTVKIQTLTITFLREPGCASRQ